MIDRATSVATTVAAVGCGSIAGVLLAFSISVMPALSSRSAPDAITTMQRINVAIVSPMFLTLFLGAAVAASTAAVGALISASGSPVLIVAGALLYVIGCVLVTVAINVPLNDALAAVDPSNQADADVWSNYLVRWTRWNHARTGAAFAACVLFTIAS
ncbi:DUF1772 domain-containing protein [Rhodococcus sp. I2R]|uniref:anthrone oxygenase family protein n=1 Tax=Rhodococcus sp. I2R TaxID=2855445 RepID=UPI001E3CBF96|nr:anthrone oxygenase family protein [Rhodococcus sp. I2R]MCC8927674.1 DUF1772 domain-containing protein [Rhodococcus sp. I2R]